jgi:hypothetical protein
MTKIYGCSDDLIEFEGDIRGEIGCFSSDSDEVGNAQIVFDDATILKAFYNEDGIWKFTLLNKGSNFDRIELCTNNEDDPHSDIVYFKDGLKKAWYSVDGLSKVE